ncbi:3-deoxy-D-arabino-heptulosonate 7-phosphate synthase [Pigmentiphaga aceris]|uniref:3-deoxy-D-arabino-heptulosonate 7-phosphate synthase n=1 Tax=Pigmentiphaga aceris TaxID=1940612 RepID=A0A5C0AXU9_9BURK|nr:3-deoxy-D-arabino-heptulosonate 7-phosphate synthase [Pigmentiphaga aceris]QEI06394.1 3-deoxy-D-arabino-heptulosonate 7-phosphate synthase [Pigmentiphaga aceris]
MCPQPHPRLLADTLRKVARRYQLPATLSFPDTTASQDPATTLAITIEQTRIAITRGTAPDPRLKQQFLSAFANLIREAAHPVSGDASFQAMLLRYQTAHVQDYASLSAQNDQDRRAIYAIVNSVAHPAKLQRQPPSAQRNALTELHTALESTSWSTLASAAHQLIEDEAQPDTPLVQSLTRLVASPELRRLERLAGLLNDPAVQRYQGLLDRHFPRSGSEAAIAQASIAQQRGASAEAKAAQVLNTLAQRLNETDHANTDAATDTGTTYRVVTSLRVPASIPGNTERAKSEWDAVLLSQTAGNDEHTWDVCLLVEVKASVDAATTDFPRLLRGLQLLASAARDTVYTFATQQGDVRITGASLAALSTDESDLANDVLYCCDGPAEAAPRLLNAASRMQLLSSEASLAFADKLVKNQTAEPNELEPVWQALLESARWRPVLEQYPMLYGVRALMVHISDLSAAIPTANKG